jgi:hypothetical protein
MGDSNERDFDRESGVCDMSGRRYRPCDCHGICSRRSERRGG